MRKAFTLVELLVVIGIIAILAAVLVASLSGSSDSAKGTKCLANLHTLAMGSVSYAMSSGYYPLAGSIKKYTDIRMRDTTVAHGWIGWSEDSASGSYISTYNQDFDARDHSLTNGTVFSSVAANRDVYVCPLHREAFLEKNHSSEYGPCWSYVMNANFKWQSQQKPFNHKSTGAKYDSLKNKSKMLLFAELPFVENDIVDSVSFNVGASAENDPILQFAEGTGGGDELIAFNHRVGKRQVFAHVCFADGHTEKLVLPRGASQSNIRELTNWLCAPGTDFDVVLDGGEYKKLEN